jgi:hypothetical protein
MAETPAQTQERLLVYQSEHLRGFLNQWARIQIDMQTATECQLLSCLRDLLDQWKWFDDAKRLMETDLVVAWNDLKEWEQKLASPGRWMDGWTSELIDTSDGWTLEVWIPVNGQMIDFLT